MTKSKKARPTWTGRDVEGAPEAEEVKVKAKAQPAPVRQAQGKPTVINLRCLWHTRLVIGEHLTLSGRRYVFDPGEVQSVFAPDAERMLLMEKAQPPGCCGGQGNPPSVKYFEPA